MSIVDTSMDKAISTVVDCMLPRFSDKQLGVFITGYLDLTDWGYGKDGNTRERETLSSREYFNFLFTRSTNYTKFFRLITNDPAISPLWSQRVFKWDLECDHDDCWSTSVGDVLSKMHFNMVEKFEGRMVSGHKLIPRIDLSDFNHIQTPNYVQLDYFERVNPTADCCSDEGRLWDIKMIPIDFTDLIAVKSKDTKVLANSGLLIKGSERYDTYMRNHKTSYCFGVE